MNCPKLSDKLPFAMTKIYFPLVFLMISMMVGQAQNLTYELLDEDRIPEGERRSIPDIYETWELDLSEFKALVDKAPHESEKSPHHSEVILNIPNPDGEETRFKIVSFDMMEADLVAQFPDIGTWRGIAVDDPHQHIHLDWTARGLHASVRGHGKDWFVDPYLWEDNRFYQSYFIEDYPAPSTAWNCDQDPDAKTGNYFGPQLEIKVGDCQLRTYRLAVATTAEYSNFHGANNSGDAALVLAAVTTSVNRVNQVYEADLAMRMILIANQSAIFYYNPATDPYTNGSGGTMLGENQANIDAVIGTANYDIGHVFSTGGGGVASLRSPCKVNSKARGVTGQPSPVGDPFDIDYVSHEMGHQFGANHTQNNSCNRNSSTAMEPGSASTIMGYAGICNPNVQNNSDDYFHGISVQEIANYMELGTGSSCATILNNPNGNPTVTAVPDYTIPVSTPFALTASASDPDGDPVTYHWEQFDNEVGAVMPPISTNTQGPMFRSFDPSPNPTRYFPRLSDLVSNTNFDWEELPSVGRSMDFRVTVRDYNGTYGCTTEDDMIVTTSGGAGPFVVNTPNTAVTWAAGASELVDWDVAGTNLAPINCPNVDILLSTDGGFTYPTVLATAVTNNGQFFITVPNDLTSNARIMVRCSDNIFFDISDTDFTISGSVPADFSLSAMPVSQTICQGINNVSYEVMANGVGGFSDPVSINVISSPPGTTTSFSQNPITPGQTTTFTIQNTGALNPGNYNIRLQGSSTLGSRILDLQLEVLAAAIAPSSLSPADATIDVPTNLDFDWDDPEPGLLYEIEVATDPSFINTIVLETVITSEYLGSFDNNTLYYWRVRSINNCGPSAWATTQSFTTGICQTYTSTDVPLAISPNGTPTVTSDLVISDIGLISDLNVTDLIIDHSYSGDLEVSLTSPDNETTLLIENPCGGNDDIAVDIDDENSTVSFSCPLIGGQVIEPIDALSNFDNSAQNGTWTLTIVDEANLDGGSLEAWSLSICITVSSSPLPVSWLEFKVSDAGLKSLLEWAVTEERDNKGFEIQRRGPNDTEFVDIGWVAGTNSSGRNDYSFVDTDVFAGQTYFYRLKQIDFDGSFSFSPIRSIQFESGTDRDIRLFPNPTNDWIEVIFDSEESGISFDLIDGLGRRVGNYLVQGPRTVIDLRSLPSGMYHLQIKGKDWISSRKIIKH